LNVERSNEALFDGVEKKWLGLSEQNSPMDKWNSGRLKRCRVVHGGVASHATNARRGGQLGAHRDFILGGIQQRRQT
jgi:hypothetical protein